MSKRSQKSRLKKLTHDAYTIGWVCALPKEQTAAIAMLDEIHQTLPKPRTDSNTYTLGSIGNHNIVIACLPNMGTSSATAVAVLMINAFKSIKFGLMVGIGGGIPPKVRLGNVVVSQPVAGYPGVIQWDMGKMQPGGYERSGALNRPPDALLTAIDQLKSENKTIGSKIDEYLDDTAKKYPRLASKYTRRDLLKDPLLGTAGRGPGNMFLTTWHEFIAFLWYNLVLWAILPTNAEVGLLMSTGSHNTTREAKKTRKETQIHYGLIASGNRVIKDAKFRNALDKDFNGNLLCIEMEAAGLMNDFPCIVIRGICDYADAAKNKEWQEYAAATAAAFAKELQGHVQPSDVDTGEGYT